MPKKATAVGSVQVNQQDDGTNLVSIFLQDTDGLQVLASQLNNTWPSTLAVPTFVFADATPGPSAYAYAGLATPTPSTVVPGAFDIGSVTAVQPIVAGSGQGVDSTLGIATGLPTAPYTTDGGTWTLTSDPNAVGGATVDVT
jgi:hypothetical protein